MSRQCCVPNCKRQDVKLHHMPVSRAKLTLWLKVISAAVPCDTFEDLTWAKLSKLFICHKHFERQYIRPSMRLGPNACPTLFSADEIVSGTPAKTYAELGTYCFFFCYSITIFIVMSFYLNSNAQCRI